ncbi:MAG TPA: hypothetical protein VFN30_14615 [Chitinophagaceae bacterium]|nr:hypothetical protein [Chitinophagaceae bacterium]
MKLLLLIVILFFNTIVLGQKKSKQYNTKIDKAKTVNIKNGITYINNAKSVTNNGIVMAKILLAKATRRLDTIGHVYISELVFINSDSLMFQSAVNLDLVFNKKVLFAQQISPIGIYGEKLNSDSLSYNLICKDLAVTSFTVQIISKEPITIKTYGVYGKLN